MKKIILAIVLLTACAAAYGQYIPEGTLKRSGSGMKINGQKLSKEQQTLLLSDIDGNDYTRTWKNANLTRKWGIGLTAAGGTVAVVGAGGTMVMAIAAALGVAIGVRLGIFEGDQRDQKVATFIAFQLNRLLRAIVIKPRSPFYSTKYPKLITLLSYFHDLIYFSYSSNK